jgi:hypothetical protein
MPLHRDDLPQLGDRQLLSDSGLETDLIFNKGWDLPGFASFPLLESDEGRSTLQAYYREHVAVAAEHGLGFVFETVTWRSNPEWVRGWATPKPATQLVCVQRTDG